MRPAYRCDRSKWPLFAHWLWLIILLVILGLSWLMVDVLPVHAESVQTVRDDDCLMCHGDTGLIGWFRDGDLVSLYVDKGVYEQSVHGPAGLNCVACHTDHSSYPHSVEVQITCMECHSNDDDSTLSEPHSGNLRVELVYNDHREMTLEKNEACRSCHEKEYEISGPSAHANVFEAGNRDSALCIDCHGSHNIQKPQEPRAKIAQICGECHSAAYSTYKSSVHGEALAADSNPDVPTCVDCHGVHNVRGPRVATYRNDTIAICGSCHSDPDMMSKYGLSTDVFKTYVEDFHGRTVNQLRLFDPSTPCDKAVCFDCHGIHNIRSADDPLSTVHPDNLQQTCQACHGDASASFALSWLSHDEPTAENQPIIAGVNTVYSVLTPLVIGSFLLYIGLDFGKRRLEQYRVIKAAETIAKKELEDHDFEI